MDWNKLIPWAALFISAVALDYSCEANDIAKQANQYTESALRKHIKPTIQGHLDIENSNFIIVNDSPIPIESIRIKSKAYCIKRETLLSCGSMSLNDMSKSFYSQLEPNGDIKINLEPLPSDFIINSISAVAFQISYFRPSDMERFEKELFFFIDGGELFEHSDFQERYVYKELLEKISDDFTSARSSLNNIQEREALLLSTHRTFGKDPELIEESKVKHQQSRSGTMIINGVIHKVVFLSPD